MEHGIFCISLDLELFWGVRDHRTINDYGGNIRNVHIIVPRLLELFKQYNIHCTWATVGILFCADKQELLKNIPEKKPNYKHTEYDPYKYIDGNLLDEIYHFCPDLIAGINTYPGQEIATHTFSHYYCLEEGQTIESFGADIKAAVRIAKEKNYTINSIVFPRNQFNEEYLQVCKANGIAAYRGNELNWLYKAKSRNKENNFRRINRLADAYINLSGHNTYILKKMQPLEMVNIPSSRFLRPYDKKLQLFENLRLKRICNGITYAAKNKELYHLWWHPHNFGSDIGENFSFLDKILQHFSRMKAEYEMQSLNMNEITNQLNSKD